MIQERRPPRDIIISNYSDTEYVKYNKKKSDFWCKYMKTGNAVVEEGTRWKQVFVRCSYSIRWFNRAREGALNAQLYWVIGCFEHNRDKVWYICSTVTRVRVAPSAKGVCSLLLVPQSIFREAELIIFLRCARCIESSCAP